MSLSASLLFSLNFHVNWMCVCVCVLTGVRQAQSQSCSPEVRHTLLFRCVLMLCALQTKTCLKDIANTVSISLFGSALAVTQWDTCDGRWTLDNLRQQPALKHSMMKHLYKDDIGIKVCVIMSSLKHDDINAHNERCLRRSAKLDLVMAVPNLNIWGSARKGEHMVNIWENIEEAAAIRSCHICFLLNLLGSEQKLLLY